MDKVIKASSAGDVTLYKALIYEMPRIELEDYAEYYVEEIGAYVFIWSYVYNRRTERGASDARNHKDVRNSLPKEILQGEQYDLMFDIDESGKYLHDRYGTPNHIKNYILKEFQRGAVNLDF